MQIKPSPSIRTPYPVQPRGGSGSPVQAAAPSPIAQAFPGLDASVMDIASRAFSWLKGLFTMAVSGISQLLQAVPAGAVAAAPAPSGSYTVQGGDSLYRIAQRTLGNGDRWPEIFEANRHQIASANTIFPGQVLVIPGVAAPAPAQSPAPSAGDFGGRAAAAGRALQAAGYRYTVNLTTNFNPVRFQVGCCADFAVDAWAKAGIDLFSRVGNPHSCTSLVNYFKGGGDGHQWIGAGGRSAPGDMIFFDWDRSGDPDHVAIVTEVDANGTPTQIVETYDDNLPARERSVTGSLGYVFGYGRA